MGSATGEYATWMATLSDLRRQFDAAFQNGHQTKARLIESYTVCCEDYPTGPPAGDYSGCAAFLVGFCRNPVPAVDADGKYLVGENPIMDADGKPILGPDGLPLVFGPGLWQKFILFNGRPNDPFAGLAKEAAHLVSRQLPASIRSSLWERFENCTIPSDEAIWPATLFELARQQKLTGMDCQERAWHGNQSVATALLKAARSSEQLAFGPLTELAAVIPDPPQHVFYEIENVHRASCRAIDAILAMAEAERAPAGIDAPSDPAKRRITVHKDSRECRLDGTHFSLTAEGAVLLNALVEADGEYVAASSVVNKPDRVRRRLPAELRRLIESDPGKGTRIPRQALYAPPDGSNLTE